MLEIIETYLSAFTPEDLKLIYSVVSKNFNVKIYPARKINLDAIMSIKGLECVVTYSITCHF